MRRRVITPASAVSSEATFLASMISPPVSRTTFETEPAPVRIEGSGNRQWGALARSSDAVHHGFAFHGLANRFPFARLRLDGGLVVGDQNNCVAAIRSRFGQIGDRVVQGIDDVRAASGAHAGYAVRNPLAVCGQVFDALDAGREGKQGDLVFRLELLEGALGDPAQFGDIGRHAPAPVDDQGDGKRQLIAGKDLHLLPNAVFEYQEVVPR